MTASGPTAGRLEPEKRERVRLGRVLHRAAHTFRRHPRRVVGIAAMLAVPMTIVEAIVYGVSDLELSDNWTSWLTVQAIVVIGTISTVFFWEFYAGLLDRVCLEDQHGHPRYGVRETFRTLPYLRLMLASVIVWGLYLVLGALGEIPAMVALSFFAIAGPIINSEGQPVYTALRRSARLVSHAFWTTTVLITIPLVAEAWIAWGVEGTLHGSAKALTIAAEVVLVIVLTPTIGVVEVTLAHTLMRRDPLPGEAGAIWKLRSDEDEDERAAAPADASLNDGPVTSAPAAGIGEDTAVSRPAGAGGQMVQTEVPRRLTLEEVRASGVTARASDERGEFRWMGGTVRTGEKIWWRPLMDDGGREGVWTLRPDLTPPSDGWQHEPPCACKHCRGIV